VRQRPAVRALPAAFDKSWTGSWPTNGTLGGDAGCNKSAGCVVELSSSASATKQPLTLAPLSVGASAVMVTVPPTFPPGAVTVRVVCGAERSNALPVNARRASFAARGTAPSGPRAAPTA